MRYGGEDGAVKEVYGKLISWQRDTSCHDAQRPTVLPTMPHHTTPHHTTPHHTTPHHTTPHHTTPHHTTPHHTTPHHTTPHHTTPHHTTPHHYILALAHSGRKSLSSVISLCKRDTTKCDTGGGQVMLCQSLTRHCPGLGSG